MTAMDDLPAFLAVESDADRLHQTSTIAVPVAGQIIHMQRAQAKRAVVPVASVGQCQNFRAAMGADKSCVFSFSAHTKPPDI